MFAVVADELAATALNSKHGGPTSRDPVWRARAGKIGYVDGRNDTTNIGDSKLRLFEVICVNEMVLRRETLEIDALVVLSVYRAFVSPQG